jgi:hypothetical protein
LSYRESVHHHVIGNLANLGTLQAQARKLREYFYDHRKVAVDPTGPYAKRTFAILPTANQSRLRDLIQLLQLEGIEVFEATDNFTAAATDQLGREFTAKTIPAGAILVPNRQPLAHLIAGMLEFDPRFSPTTLEDERKELLRKGQSRIYDTTAWNLTMFYGLEALTLASELPEAAKPYPAITTPKPGATISPPAVKDPVAYILSGADDLSVTVAARLMEEGIQMRMADKDFRLDDQDFPRGSLAVTPLDNRHYAGDLGQAVKKQAESLGLEVAAVSTGLAPGQSPDIGGRHFRRLEPPRIALMGREGFSAGEYGSTWLVLDRHLGIRHSHLGRLEGDLSRYNVLIMPDGRSSGLSSNALTQLREWVKAGGTVIAVANSAANFIAEKADFSKVRALPEVLGKLAEYELAIFREWLGRAGKLPATEAIWSFKANPAQTYPWQTVDGPHPEEKELKRRDAWQTLFMPEGTLLATRVDTNHWLTVGCGELLPVLVGKQPVLMAAEGTDAPIRYGYFVASEKPAPPPAQPEPPPPAEKKDAPAREKKEPPRVGWCALPPGTEMHLRMSGLLWPEASHRLANAAWVTRESFGRGQVILFATSPTFRGAARGMTRVFLNAVVYGPGCGAAPPVRP